MKKLAMIFVFIIVAHPVTGYADETVNYTNYPQIINAIKQADVYLDSVYTTQNLPSISVAVTLDQDIIWQKALGMADLEQSIPANVNTIYRIQSITKVFTASRLLQLRDNGELHLDEPLKLYLPSLQVKGNENVTFRQILSHLAGLPNETPDTDHWNTYQFPSYEEYNERLKTIEAVQPPFVGYKYSNLGFNIIGMGLSSVGNEPYENQITNNILKPLSMSRSGFSVSPENASEIAVGYELLDGMQKRTSKYSDMGAVNPSGGLFSTVLDMANFLKFQFREDNNILSVNTRREMRTAHYAYPSWWGGIGLSWHLDKLDDLTVFYHGGGAPGYVAQLAGIDELKLGLALCINTITNQHDISKELLAIFAFPAKDLLAELEAESIPLLGSEAEMYEGIFYMKESPILRVWTKDQRLWAIQEGAPEGNEFQLVPSEIKHQFVMLGGPLNGEKADFSVDSSGHVVTLKAGSFILTPEND